MLSSPFNNTMPMSQLNNEQFQTNSCANSNHNPITSSQINYDKNEVHPASKKDTAKLCAQMREEITSLINLVEQNKLLTVSDCELALEHLKQAAGYIHSVNLLESSHLSFKSVEDLEKIVLEKKSVFQAAPHIEMARIKNASLVRNFLSLLELGAPDDDNQLKIHLESLRIGLTFAFELRVELNMAEELNSLLQDETVPLTLQIDSNILQFQQTIRYMEAELAYRAVTNELSENGILYEVNPQESSLRLNTIRPLMNQIKPYIDIREDCKIAFNKLAKHCRHHELNVFTSKAEILKNHIKNHIADNTLDRRIRTSDQYDIEDILETAIKDTNRKDVRRAIIDSTPEEFAKKSGAVSKVIVTYFRQQNALFCLPSINIGIDPAIHSEVAKRKIQAAIL